MVLAFTTLAGSPGCLSLARTGIGWAGARRIAAIKKGARIFIRTRSLQPSFSMAASPVTPVGTRARSALAAFYDLNGNRETGQKAQKRPVGRAVAEHCPVG